LASLAGQITGTPVPGTAASNLVTAAVSDANHQIGGVASSWAVTATVPALLSEPLSEATSLVTNAGLTLGRVSYTRNRDHAVPAGRYAAEIGSPVDITLSTCTSHGGGSTGPK
jgi:hypothetical protein